MEPAIDDSADGADSVPSIYHTLLSLYLAPPAPYNQDGEGGGGPLLGPALSLLSRHGSRLPAGSTLSLIPDTLPVRDLAPYFRGRIRAANSVVNAARVEVGLRYPQLVRSQAELLLGDDLPVDVAAEGGGGGGGRNRRVLIGEERMCGVCHKRLGNSVIAVLPDNAVVHYGCLNRVGGSGAGGTASSGGGLGGSPLAAQKSVRAGGWGRIGS